MAGSRVIISDLDSQRLGKLADELRSVSPDSVYAIQADIATGSGIDHLIRRALSLAGRIDGAVHSAYPTSPGWGASFEELTEEYLAQDLSMQLGGAILFSQRILRCFRDQGGGHLIHLSSIQGVQAPKFEHYEGTDMTSPVEYAAIKSGIIAITRWLAKYYRSQNIRVNCVSPGGILDAQPSSFLERYRRSCTNIGMLSSDHVASAIVFLFSSDSQAINGQNLIVDDGWTL